MPERPPLAGGSDEKVEAWPVVDGGRLPAAGMKRIVWIAAGLTVRQAMCHSSSRPQHPFAQVKSVRERSNVP